MLAVIVVSHIRLRAMITVRHRDAEHRGEGRMIIARGLMCEATMTNNTGLNSIISWVVDLNEASQCTVADLFYIKVILDVTASAC